MLELRTSILDKTDLSLDGDAAAIMATWDPSTEACSTIDCIACLLSDYQCGVLDVSRGGTTCNWMYIACSGGAVSSISLSELWRACTAAVAVHSEYTPLSERQQAFPVEHCGLKSPGCSRIAL